MNKSVPQLVNEFVAAQALGLSVHTLRKDRITRRRWPYLKAGRTVRYDLDALLATLKREGGQ